MRRAAAAFVALLLFAPMAAAQQNGNADATCREVTADVVARVRAALEQYADLDNAIAQGYRRVGHDFPGMGEHWVSLREATRDSFDPDRPQILLYINAGDERRIAGAAFTAMQDPGEPMPGPAFLRGLWHEHSGTLDDELFAVDHSQHPTTDRFRVMVLHVWTRWSRPGYEFDVENWALPFHREGVATPAAYSIAVARAVSLPGSRDYYMNALHRMGVPSGTADRARLAAMIDMHAASVSSVLDARASTDAWTRAEQGRLEATWRALMRDVQAAWPSVAPQLSGFEQSPHAGSLCT